MKPETNQPTQEQLNTLFNKIQQNTCTYNDPTSCSHYNECFNYCMTPSIQCSYRKDTTQIN